MIIASTIIMLQAQPIMLVRVVDGDTIRVDLACDVEAVCKNQAVRIRGVDTPELRGKCAFEKAAAKRAKDRLAELLADEGITLTNIDKDKYGRLLAHVSAGGVDVAQILINEGLGRAYNGGKRQAWCK